MAFKKNTPQSRDILREKEAEVTSLAKQADDAVDVVTRTISRLELINQQLDDAVSEIDSYTDNLAKTRESMNKQRKNNTALISNFSKLLSTESTNAEETAQ